MDGQREKRGVRLRAEGGHRANEVRSRMSEVCGNRGVGTGQGNEVGDWWSEVGGQKAGERGRSISNIQCSIFK